jgi:hypothetical protein
MSIETAHSAPRAPLIKGIAIEAGGYTWEMPALNMRQLREYQESLAALDMTNEYAVFETSIRAVHAALGRNYPGLSLDDTLDIVDAGNFQAVMGALRGISGLVTSGEAEARQTLTT